MLYLNGVNHESLASEFTAKFSSSQFPIKYYHSSFEFVAGLFVDRPDVSGSMVADAVTFTYYDRAGPHVNNEGFDHSRCPGTP